MMGSSLNQYRIIATIGAGGMGEVFRARDTRLNRDVAVKVLPKDFVADANCLRRFEQEAKTLATLNHPNILTIYDAGLHEGAPYLVSELLEGKTLRDETNGGALPVRKAVEYALQIANGLAAAHGKGIIHRDLKPENIFVTNDGRVKVLDFGLAKLCNPSPALRPPSPLGGERDGVRGESDVPTIRIDAAAIINTTEPGMVLGTPAYMSPEQVRGEPADHRADIFAFGCVLYEMLSGTRAFRRNTPIESMNAVLSDEPPDLSASNANIPLALERIVQRCLQKQPDNRFQSAKDLAFTIEVAQDRSQKQFQSTTASPRSARKKSLLAAISVTLLAIVGAFIANKFRSPGRTITAPSIRYLTYSGRDYSPAAAADGKRICFSSDRDGVKRIWVKEIASGMESPLTSGPDDFPRFSRDGSMILFTRAFGINRALFRVPSIGGEPAKVVNDAQFGDWSPDGRQITFVRWTEDGNSSVHTSGIDGSAESVVHRFTGRASAPRWAPNKNTIAVAMNDSGRQQGMILIDLGKRKVRTSPAPHPYNLLSSVAWDASGEHLFFMQAESGSANSGGSTAALFCQRAGTDKFEKLLWSQTLCTILDVLPSGNVLMDARSSRQNLKEYAVASQQTSPRSLTLGNSTDRQPSYSPDGDEVVFSSNRSGNLEIWSASRKTGVLRRLTDDKGDDWDPAISSDGKYLIWSANRSGNFEIWIANADGTSPRQVTHDGFSAENPTMTRDGRWIFYASTHPEKLGIWKIHPDGSGAMHFVKKATTSNAEVSPDGKYVAYVDNRRFISVVIRVSEVETGIEVPFEVRVDAAKETRALLGRVRWMPDGKSLVFLGQDERGVHGLYVQDFVPGQDTMKTRRPIGPFDPENSAESFGISPDGQFITMATWEQFFSIMVTEDLPSL